MQQLITNGKYTMIQFDHPHVIGDVVRGPDGSGRLFRVCLPAFPTTDAANLYNVVEVDH